MTYNGIGIIRWIKIKWIKSLISMLYKGSTGGVNYIITNINIFGQ